MARGGNWTRSAYVLLAFVAMAVGYQLTAHTTEAFNDWEGSLRKWPWRASVTDTHTLTTIPYQGSHQGQEAIDIDMYLDPVHAVTKSTVVWYQYYASGGNILLTQDTEGKYISYMHLDRLPNPSFTNPGTQFVQGQYIAVSGNTPRGAYHLHLERSYDPLSGPRIPAPLAPISGTNEFVLGSQHHSDNAGIGDVCTAPCTESSAINSFHFHSFTQAYIRNGGYGWGPGVTWDDYCGDGHCWWVHYWDNGITGWPGAIQDFKGNEWIGAGALMRRQTAPYWFESDAFWIDGAIWQKYLDLGGGPSSPLGYPTTDPISGNNSHTGSPYRMNQFEAGAIVKRADWVTPPYESDGAVWWWYAVSGGPATSSCGLPTGDTFAFLDGWFQWFERGYIQTGPWGYEIGCP